MEPIQSARCLACAYPVAVPFFDAGEQPLATLAWPGSTDEARALPRYPLTFVQCPDCGHVFNRSFDYRVIPYSDKPNRMYNAGSIWQGHLAQVRQQLLSSMPAAPTVVEIGCGDGSFLNALAEERGGRYVGFDPHGGAGSERVEIRKQLFEPANDFPGLAPDVVIIRHVLEHLTDPDALLLQLAWAAAAQSKPCHLLAEVPCIDQAIEHRRLTDFFYEHVSHFTTRSFSRLMERAGEIAHLAHGYSGEVVFALVRLGVPSDQLRAAQTARLNVDRIARDRDLIARQLDALANAGKSAAIWGGTGKAAAFIHHYGADARRFPLVVDSDAEKAGSHVPGTGQRIEFRDVLKQRAVDVIIIPTHWRARDIVAEMQREGIVAAQVLIEHEGQLIDFFTGMHPYR